MVKVYFIRHAESTWNAFGDLSKDTPITDKGRLEQAPLVKGYVDLVICSSLTRTRQTLANSNLKYKDVLYTDLCREIKGGTPCDYKENEDTSVLETEEEIQDRIKTLKELVDKLSTSYHSIAIISHYCFIKKITGKQTFNCQVLEYNWV
jgi:broad specificity phosphatase PhoE